MTTPKNHKDAPESLKTQNSNYAATEDHKRSKVARFHRLICDGMSREAAARRCNSNRQTLQRWAIELGIGDPKAKK
jgi:hypothetical protein